MSRQIIETTPQRITPQLTRFAQYLGGGELQYVPVVPSPGAISLNCYPNVEAQIRENGGEAVEGWLIWEEVRGRWLLANHHSVWRNPAGDLIDITPQTDGESRIMFCVCDRKWDGRHQIAGVFQPLVTDRIVRRLCETGNERERWLERNTSCGEPYVADYRFARLTLEFAKLWRRFA